VVSGSHAPRRRADTRSTLARAFVGRCTLPQLFDLFDLDRKWEGWERLAGVRPDGYQTMCCTRCGYRWLVDWQCAGPCIFLPPGWWACPAGCTDRFRATFPGDAARMDKAIPWDPPPDLRQAARSAAGASPSHQAAPCCTLADWTAERLKRKYDALLLDPEQPRRPDLNEMAQAVTASRATLARHCKNHLGLKWTEIRTLRLPETISETR
jgi:hypothetical protein